MAPPLAARAFFLGDRIDLRGLAAEGVVAHETQPFALPEGGWLFLFRWGAAAMIGGPEEAVPRVLARLRPHVTAPLDDPPSESTVAVPGAAEDTVEPDGTVRLVDTSPARLAVLADALAKSAALAHQEEALGETFDRIEPVLARLRGRGRLGTSTRPLLAVVGEAIAARTRAAARIAPDEKPDLLWDRHDLVRLHLALAEEFELAERSAALERKHELASEAVSMLLALVESRRTLVLEAAVVLLIGIEVVTALYALFAGG